MRNRFFFVLLGAALLFAALSLGLILAIPGRPFTIAFDDISESIIPLLAAAACGLTAWRGTGRTRQAWALIGLSAASWGLGQMAWTYQEVILGLKPADLS